MSGNEISRWADEAMFRSESHNADEGPKVHLLAMPPDPLGQIAACAKMYKGEVVRSLSDVTHAERREYLAEMQKTKLAMPLESVTFHFMLENVTRAFTHQLVRQRTAAYAQESMRFAVVEDMTQAVALPPSLSQYRGEAGQESLRYRESGLIVRSEAENQFWSWVDTVNAISEGYGYLVSSGMPAEDARGLMPTNIITRVNYITNLRGLLDHAGNRLCTQAQFEWRAVFAQIASAIRNYEPHGARLKSSGDNLPTGGPEMLGWLDDGDRWQYEAIADLLRPVCYQTGKCAFKADFDRKCSIRGRVDDNEAIGRPSTEWGEATNRTMPDGTNRVVLPIHPREWLTDPEAAR